MNFDPVKPLFAKFGSRLSMPDWITTKQSRRGGDRWPGFVCGNIGPRNMTVIIKINEGGICAAFRFLGVRIQTSQDSAADKSMNKFASLVTGKVWVEQIIVIIWAGSVGMRKGRVNCCLIWYSAINAPPFYFYWVIGVTPWCCEVGADKKFIQFVVMVTR